MTDLFSVKGKVIIVTGGAGVLGKQIVDHLEAEGAVAVSFDINGSPPVDVTSKGSVGHWFDSLFEFYRRIDGLVHAAAINAALGSAELQDPWSPYESFPLALWNRELEVNLTGANLVTQAVAPVMMRQERGSIVFIASDLALIAPNNSIYEEGKFKDLAYCTSKAGLLGLMRAWAAYLGPHGVRVNALAPGGMENGQDREFVNRNSRLNMLGRMAQPGEYNGPIQFLLSEASSYMTGATLVVDGGRTAW